MRYQLNLTQLIINYQCWERAERLSREEGSVKTFKIPPQIPPTTASAMPVSLAVCETANVVNAALRESLGVGVNVAGSVGGCVAATASRSGTGSGSGSAADEAKTGDDSLNDNLQSQIVANAKRVLFAKIEYEEVKNYSESVLAKLKSKYIVIEPDNNFGNNKTNGKAVGSNGHGKWLSSSLSSFIFSCCLFLSQCIWQSAHKFSRRAAVNMCMYSWSRKCLDQIKMHTFVLFIFRNSCIQWKLIFFFFICLPLNMYSHFWFCQNTVLTNCMWVHCVCNVYFAIFWTTSSRVNKHIFSYPVWLCCTTYEQRRRRRSRSNRSSGSVCVCAWVVYVVVSYKQTAKEKHTKQNKYKIVKSELDRQRQRRRPRQRAHYTFLLLSTSESQRIAELKKTCRCRGQLLLAAFNQVN